MESRRGVLCELAGEGRDGTSLLSSVCVAGTIAWQMPPIRWLADGGYSGMTVVNCTAGRWTPAVRIAHGVRVQLFYVTPNNWRAGNAIRAVISTYRQYHTFLQG